MAFDGDEPVLSPPQSEQRRVVESEYTPEDVRNTLDNLDLQTNPHHQHHQHTPEILVSVPVEQTERPRSDSLEALEAPEPWYLPMVEVAAREAEKRLRGALDQERVRWQREYELWESQDASVRGEAPEPRLTKVKLAALLAKAESFSSDLGLGERETRALTWVSAETLWSKGPGPAVRRFETTAAAYKLGRLLTEEEFTQQLDQAAEVLEEHNPASTELPPDDYQSLLLDIALAGHLRGPEAAGEVARSKVLPVKGSAGLDRISYSLLDTGTPLAKVLSFLPHGAAGGGCRGLAQPCAHGGSDVHLRSGPDL